MNFKSKTYLSTRVKNKSLKNCNRVTRSDCLAEIFWHSDWRKTIDTTKGASSSDENQHFHFSARDYIYLCPDELIKLYFNIR